MRAPFLLSMAPTLALVACDDALPAASPAAGVPATVQAALTGIASPEHRTDLPVTGPGSGQQMDTQIAYGGGVYLAVWTDTGRGKQGFAVYGARVTVAGQVLDPMGFRISTINYYEGPASVAYGGGKFLVAWQQNHSSYPNNFTSDVYGAFVTPTGSAGANFAISTATNNQGNPTVASDGTDFVVAWDDTRGTTADIYAARVKSNGTVRDPSGIAVSTAAKGAGRASPSTGRATSSRGKTRGAPPTRTPSAFTRPA